MSAPEIAGNRKRSCESHSGPASKSKNLKPPGDTIDYAAVIKGTSRKLRSCNPLTIIRNLHRVMGGNCKDSKVLPSGDLFVRCQNEDQIRRLIQCKNLGDVGGANIEVTVELYKTKAPETKE